MIGGNTTDSKVKAQGTRRSVLKMAIFGSVAVSAAGLDRAGATPPVSIPVPRARCLLKGVRVLTIEGEVKVEDLAIGDILPTMFGGTRPIRWIGRYPIKRSSPSKPWLKDARPVRIARSAFALGVPRADLYVSQAHGLLIDNVLVSAGALINETTITLDEADSSNALDFFHIKLDRHDVIFAEGAPVETLLNVDESAVNFAEYFRMYGTPMDEEVPCLPILSPWRRGSSLKSRVRSAVTWTDRRRQIGVIRDRLAKRGIMLSRELEPSF